MPPNWQLFRIAVLDDYQNVALSIADWSVLDGQATVTVFNDHLSDIEAVVARLRPFEVVCVMRERTPMTHAVIEGLPRLRLIASTAVRNASIDLLQQTERCTLDCGARQIDVSQKRRRVRLTPLEKVGGPLNPKTRSLYCDRGLPEPRGLIRVAASVGAQEMVAQAHE